MKDLTKGSPLPLILGFAVPVLIGNLFQLFYNLADTRIVGSFLGDQALAAVGATSSLNSLMIGMMNGLSNGFAMIPARNFGANDREQVRRSIGAIFVLSLLTTAVLTVLTVGFLPQILSMLNTPSDLIGQAAAYFRIILLGMTVTLLYNVSAAVLRAIGDSVTPLLFLILAAVLNVGLDLLCVGVLRLGVQGAALATVAAQTVSVVCCLLYARKKYPMFWPKREDFRVSVNLAGQLYGAGVSMALMLSLVNFGSVFLQGVINTFGVNIIVAHTAARRLTELFMLPMAVLGVTLATYCSQNYGAKRPDRIRQGLWQGLLLAWAGWLLAVVLSFTIVPTLVRMVTGTDNQEVIQTATRYLRINTIFYFVTDVISLVRNSLQGVGDRWTPLVSSSIELFGKLGIVIFLTPSLGYFGVMISEPIVWFLMVIPLIWQVLRHPAFRKDGVI
ncbi:MAG: MATE family efflux transporter [Butyricicoccus sp.]|nr:MATE family efflux transporter [Butyricicoccus pullicaecorum]MDY5972553.1 MATE family efflux transporter [Butyricicoccus sp.]